MNGYKILSDSYRAIANSPDTDLPTREKLERDIEVLDLLAKLSDSERVAIFDTGAFNDVLRAYCIGAMVRAGVDTETRQSVLMEIRDLLDSTKANDALDRWGAGQAQSG